MLFKTLVGQWIDGNNKPLRSLNSRGLDGVIRDNASKTLRHGTWRWAVELAIGPLNWPSRVVVMEEETHSSRGDSNDAAMSARQYSITVWR